MEFENLSEEQMIRRKLDLTPENELYILNSDEIPKKEIPKVLNIPSTKDY